MCSIGMQRKLPYYPALIVTLPHRFNNYVEAAAGELPLPIEGESIGTRRCSVGLDDELSHAQWMLGAYCTYTTMNKQPQ